MNQDIQPPVQNEQVEQTVAPASTPTKERVNPYLTPISVLVAGIFIAGAVIYTHYLPPSSTAQGQTATAPSVNIKDVVTDNEPYVGKANAPVTIAYWGDYQCPVCKGFETQVLPSIINDYVKTGKVKIVFKDYQFLGPDSETAGLFARAVWELYPDKYFAWHEAMFNAQDAENGGFGDEASIEQLTKTISGINVAKVTALLNQKRTTYQQELDADKTEGMRFGVNGTPGFIIGQQLLPGFYPYSAFNQLIDEELK